MRLPGIVTPLAPASGDIAHGIGHPWYFCLKYVDITLYPSFQGPTSVPCFVDEVLPLNGSQEGIVCGNLCRSLDPAPKDSQPIRVGLPDLIDLDL